MTACSFDRDMMYKMGEALGDECRAESVDVLLSPAMNIKRSPLCGRNFEYFSEDSYVTGELAAAFVKGLQSKGVGASVKHFAANSQEKNRVTSSSEVDERTLREIYLSVFEKVVKEAKPWTVMASYNKVNGVYASENEYLLTQILRKEWGFDGAVISDWNAVVHKLQGIKAGLDLEMPGTGGRTDQQVIRGINEGTLDEGDLDQAVMHMLKLIRRCSQNRADAGADTAGGAPAASVDSQSGAPADYHEDHHRMAVEIAQKSMVLLKMKGRCPWILPVRLPLSVPLQKRRGIRAGGSAHVYPYRVESAMDCVGGCSVMYARGYRLDTDAPDADQDIDEQLLLEAVKLAGECDAAVIFAGIPEAEESEGYDKTHLDLPQNQNRLIEAIAEQQEKYGSGPSQRLSGNDAVDP